MLRKLSVAVVFCVLCFVGVIGTIQADVFHMGIGLTSLEMVPVGNPGNAGEWTFELSGVAPYFCGAVGYAYNIGKYEVTAGQYADFLNKVGGVDTYALYNTEMSRTDYGSGIARSGGGIVGNPYTYTVDAAFANRPVNYVSWGDSARFANWLHNGQPTGSQGLSTTEDGAYYLNGAISDAALCAVSREADWKWAITSEAEWYKAAYYKGGSTNAGYWVYPTKSNDVPGQDMADASGNNANYAGAPNPIDSGKYTTLVGEFQNSDSPYGTFDQGGNVWEWNEKIIDSSCRQLRGGSWGYYFPNNLAASYHSSAYRVSTESGYRGFRVASVPEPGSIVLFFIGAVGMLIHCWCKRRTA
jgi:formylglycine-generating enzyme